MRFYSTQAYRASWYITNVVFRDGRALGQLYYGLENVPTKRFNVKVDAKGRIQVGIGSSGTKIRFKVGRADET